MPHKWKPKALICSECSRQYVRTHPHRTRRFCSRRCSSIASNRLRGDRRTDIVCVACGKIVNVSMSNAATKFCSRACYNKGVANVKTCPQCNAEFRGGNKAQVFCSRKCRGLSERKAVSYITHQGYRVIYIDAQPVLEHRHVMEQMIGRKLLPIENVHHLNGDRLHNDPSNLELWDRAQTPGQRVADKIAWCIAYLKLHRVLPAEFVHVPT